jgi:hypothetical protein
VKKDKKEKKESKEKKAKDKKNKKADWVWGWSAFQVLSCHCAWVAPASTWIEHRVLSRTWGKKGAPQEINDWQLNNSKSLNTWITELIF